MPGLLDQLFGGGGAAPADGGGLLGGLSTKEKLMAFGMHGPEGILKAQQMKQLQAMQQLQMQGLLSTQAKTARELQEKEAQDQAVYGSNINWQRSADPSRFPLGWDHTGGLLQGASPQESALARGMGSGKAAEFFGERLMPKPSWQVLPNGQLANMAAPMPQVMGGDFAARPDKIRTLEAAGIDPRDPRVRDKIIEGLGQAKTEVNLDQRTEGAEARKVGEFYGEAYTNLQKAAMGAPATIAKLDRLDQLLDQVNTGKFAGTAVEIKAIAKAAGINLDALGIRDDVAPAQAAQALANEMALELRNPSGGAGMPGAMSDSDRVFLRSMVPGIEQTPEGRKLVIESRKKLIQRDQDVARLAREYRRKKGTIDEGFFTELQAFAEANPLFSSTKAPAAPINPAQMSDDELKRALQ